MPDEARLAQQAEAAIARRRAQGLLRDRRERTVEGAPGPRVVVRGRLLWNFASNGYLGLSTHPRVVAALQEEAALSGASSTASRLVGGNLSRTAELEAALAALKGKDDALVFSSGYAANLGVLVALGRALDAPGAPPPLFLSDALNHASIVDGCRLARAEVLVYPHNDVAAVEAALSLAKVEGRRAVVVTESRFSMDGDQAPLFDLVAACRAGGAALVVDEAHATGVDGGGRGLVHAHGLTEHVDVVVGTLGKALGAHGAFVAAATPVVRWIENAARTFVFSTGLPGPIAAAAIEALAVLATERPDQLLRQNVDDLHALLQRAGLADVVPAAADGPIVPIVVGGSEAAVALARFLVEDGVLAVAIRPPTVPAGKSRVRLSLRADHDEDALVALVGALARARAAGLLPVVAEDAG